MSDSMPLALRDISLAQLRYFLCVADTGSFQAAAVRSCRSQPALSLAIKQLEDRLGHQLFEAGSRSTLTPYGQYCLPLVRDLLGRHENVLEALERYARNEVGSLSLGTITAFATNWLPALVGQYSDRHPRAALRLLDDNSLNVTRMVLSGDVDFGVTAGAALDKRLVFEPLITDVFGLVCRYDHPLAARRQLRWSELERLTLIGTTAHTGLAGTAEADPVRRCSIFASNMISLLSMIDHGVGVTVLARLDLPPWMDKLAFVPLARPTVKRTLGILRLADRSLSPAAESMRQLMHEYAKGTWS